MLLFCFMRTEATMHLLLNCMVVQLGLGEVVQISSVYCMLCYWKAKLQNIRDFNDMLINYIDNKINLNDGSTKVAYEDVVLKII